MCLYHSSQYALTWQKFHAKIFFTCLGPHSDLAHHAYNDMDGSKGVDQTVGKVDGTKAGENQQDAFVNKKRVRERQA